MDYAIMVLKKDHDLINKALEDTKAWEAYPESFKRQELKKKQLDKAIEKLQEKQCKGKT